MGQQPNQEISDAKAPRSTLEPGPALRWYPTKPGLITAPDQVPSFTHIGPDAGWALRIIGLAELPDDSPHLKGVAAGLMTARAAELGRAPVQEDLEAALAICGYGYEPPPEVLEQRQRWLAAVPHEQRPGHMAADEVDLNLLVQKPEQIRFVLTRSG